jgi:hypothetical protein
MRSEELRQRLDKILTLLYEARRLSETHHRLALSMLLSRVGLREHDTKHT